MAQDNVICTLNLNDYTPISVDGSAVPDSVMRLTMFIQKSLYQDATQSQRTVSTFAIPVSTKEGISWHIPKVFGTRFLVEPLDSLSEDEQVFYLLEICRVLKDLKDRCKKILSHSSTVFSEKILAKFFYDEDSPDHLGAALYVPDTSHIYIVNDRPVIVGWGFQKKFANWKKNRCNIYKVVEQASDQDFFDTLEYFSYVTRPPVLTKESEQRILKRIYGHKSDDKSSNKEPEQTSLKANSANNVAKQVQPSLLTASEVASQTTKMEHPEMLMHTPSSVMSASTNHIETGKVSDIEHPSAEILNLTSTLDRKKVANKIKEQGHTQTDRPEDISSSNKLIAPSPKHHIETEESSEDPPVDEQLINSALEAEKLVKQKNQEVVSLAPVSDEEIKITTKIKGIVASILIVSAAIGLGIISYMYLGEPGNNTSNITAESMNTRNNSNTEVIARTKDSIADYKPEIRSIIIPFKKLPDIGYDKGDGASRITHLTTSYNKQ